MKFSTRVIFLFSTLLIVVSCKKENEPANAFIYGMVSTADGQPVSNTNIHIKNYLEPGGFITSAGSGNTGIEFSVTERGLFLIELFRYGNTNPFYIIYDDTLNAGIHRIGIPDSVLSNGTYRYEITATSQRSERFFLINKPDSALVHTIPFTRTNQDGEFIIDARTLAIGEILLGQGGSNIMVGDSLRILVEEDGSIVAQKEMKVSLHEDSFIEVLIE